MATIESEAFERSTAGRGLKTVALVLILGSVAVMADHAFFVAPHAQPKAEPARMAQTGVAIDGFALPDHLHPTAADVDNATPTF
ncbi:MAG: hypothetical protein U1F41_03810 [Burkholderiales bacterium]